MTRGQTMGKLLTFQRKHGRAGKAGKARLRFDDQNLYLVCDKRIRARLDFEIDVPAPYSKVKDAICAFVAFEDKPSVRMLFSFSFLRCLRYGALMGIIAIARAHQYYIVLDARGEDLVIAFTLEKPVIYGR